MPQVTLRTGRLVLRPPQSDDAAAIFGGYATDPEVARWVMSTPHASIDETHQFPATFIDSGRRDDSYPWVIIVAAADALIGAMHLRVHAPRAELGFTIARPYWGHGYATEAVQAVVECPLARPAIERVQATCHVNNRASARFLERVGMEREGALRRYTVYPNLGPSAQDVQLYALMRARAAQR